MAEVKRRKSGTTGKVKCPICGTFNDKELTVCHNKKYYCQVCYEEYQREAQDYKDLMKYICENLYEIEAPTPLMLKQIKEYKEKFNYTYRGMKSTLHYFYEIQEGNDVENSIGVGIIPFVYDEAKQFYIDKKAVKDSVIGCDLEQIENNKRVINKIQSTNPNENKYKDMVLIDIEKL